MKIPFTTNSFPIIEDIHLSAVSSYVDVMKLLCRLYSIPVLNPNSFESWTIIKIVFVECPVINLTSLLLLSFKISKLSTYLDLPIESQQSHPFIRYHIQSYEPFISRNSVLNVFMFSKLSVPREELFPLAIQVTEALLPILHWCALNSECRIRVLINLTIFFKFLFPTFWTSPQNSSDLI